MGRSPSTTSREIRRNRHPMPRALRENVTCAGPERTDGLWAEWFGRSVQSASGQILG
ncbi:hypothetical protein ABZ853_28790 [Streptomyces albidoflavus]